MIEKSFIIESKNNFTFHKTKKTIIQLIFNKIYVQFYCYFGLFNPTKKPLNYEKCIAYQPQGNIIFLYFLWKRYYLKKKLTTITCGLRHSSHVSKTNQKQ